MAAAQLTEMSPYGGRGTVVQKESDGGRAYAQFTHLIGGIETSSAFAKTSSRVGTMAETRYTTVQSHLGLALHISSTFDPNALG